MGFNSGFKGLKCLPFFNVCNENVSCEMRFSQRNDCLLGCYAVSTGEQRRFEES